MLLSDYFTSLPRLRIFSEAMSSETKSKNTLDFATQWSFDIKSIWPETEEDLKCCKECENATGYTISDILERRSRKRPAKKEPVS